MLVATRSEQNAARTKVMRGGVGGARKNYRREKQQSEKTMKRETKTTRHKRSQKLKPMLSHLNTDSNKFFDRSTDGFASRASSLY